MKSVLNDWLESKHEHDVIISIWSKWFYHIDMIIYIYDHIDMIISHLYILGSFGSIMFSWKFILIVSTCLSYWYDWYDHCHGPFPLEGQMANNTNLHSFTLLYHCDMSEMVTLLWSYWYDHIVHCHMVPSYQFEENSLLYSIVIWVNAVGHISMIILIWWHCPLPQGPILSIADISPNLTSSYHLNMAAIDIIPKFNFVRTAQGTLSECRQMDDCDEL